MKRIVTIVGARPQFVKCAVVSRFLRRTVTEVLVHTGQHYDDSMSDVFFRDLEIPSPDYCLGVGSGSHGRQTGTMLSGVEDIIVQERPDVVLVYGDTNSTLAGALAAAKLGVPIGHVEAGLRSYNRRMAEEINRILTDHVSQWLFCPAENAARNLHGEGITHGVHVVGDVMYDSVRHYSEIAQRRSGILETLNISPRNYALATIHRAENTDDGERLRAIVRALESIAADGLPVVFPMHPRTRKQVASFGIHMPRIRLLEPVSYLDMLCLEQNAHVILTDSGGVQKEAYWLRVPCVTLRDETEWVETVESGWNRLTGIDSERILATVRAVGTIDLDHPPLFGNGHAAERIVEVLANG